MGARRALLFAFAVAAVAPACARQTAPPDAGATPAEATPVVDPSEVAPATAAVTPSAVEVRLPERSRTDVSLLDRARLAARYAGRRPRAWGQSIDGVMTSVAGGEGGPRTLALTFDACGGHGGDGYDAALVDFLRRERIPATLFLTGRWIMSHPSESRMLAAEPLFEIENHGTTHRPCSVSGRSAYRVRGTTSVDAVLDEILGSAVMIESLTSRAPRFFRSGTAFFDDVCVDVASDLGEAPVSFAVNGDGGAGYDRAQVRSAIASAPNGAILLFHMNHPRGATAEGLMDAVPALRERGVEFVRLEDAKAPFARAR